MNENYIYPPEYYRDGYYGAQYGGVTSLRIGIICVAIIIALIFVLYSADGGTVGNYPTVKKNRFEVKTEQFDGRQQYDFVPPYSSGTPDATPPCGGRFGGYPWRYS